MASLPPKHKIVLLGDTSVGKTSLVLRFEKNFFVGFQESTIGAAFSQHPVILHSGEEIRLDIWDTAGQERYASLAPMYYREAQGAIVVFDITLRDTWARAKDWVQELRSDGRSDLAIVLAGNKVDLAASRRVTNEEAQVFAEETGCTYLETSAKTGQNVQEIFIVLGTHIKEHFPDPTVPDPVRVPDPPRGDAHPSRQCC